MNADQIIRMVTRLFMRKAINRGMNAGIDRMAGGGKTKENMTPQERKRAQSAKQTAKRAKQSARLLRRMGRF